jgi:GH35 family endo-1,4-beta-xylanase
VKVHIEQTRHAFLFGANIFMLGCFPTPEENLKYEIAYKAIFNYATVPFYWADLEVEDGKPRFEKDSPYLYRRPPPDAVVEFCQKNRIEMKGHPLVWHSYYPKWRPEDENELMKRIERRMVEIATRYKDSIPRWEVVNEPMERYEWGAKWCNLPKDYVFSSLNMAAKYFPAKDLMALNEATTYSWTKFKGQESEYYKLIREMLDRGARVDEIGLQMHYMHARAWTPVLEGKQATPEIQFKVLDQYAEFGKPLAITELTFPSLESLPDSENVQAFVTRNFYRLWFSHPKVIGISWWNLLDHTAAANPGYDKANGGLLHRDFSPKPSYMALDRLINHEWKTIVDAGALPSAGLAFRGFHGEYSVTVTKDGKPVTQAFILKKGVPNEWTLKL